MANEIKQMVGLTFIDFIASVSIKLTLQQSDELYALFDKYKKICSEIYNKIQVLEHKIDELVYILYKLLSEEINFLESII